MSLTITYETTLTARALQTRKILSQATEFFSKDSENVKNKHVVEATRSIKYSYRNSATNDVAQSIMLAPNTSINIVPPFHLLVLSASIP